MRGFPTFVIYNLMAAISARLLEGIRHTKDVGIFVLPFEHKPCMHAAKSILNQEKLWEWLPSSTEEMANLAWTWRAFVPTAT
jgi:hypothetical protein